ncbi:hypothetical protein [Burkholderia anthina]|uniref:hypothetical protein n=1 Tax=Burkholderia anthina TaxID=179879 RepID=UPI001AA09552|nr:hypothetical protein [Burkholderia anthina]QTD92649.1 hypothetical protein J4G50_31020 [Burkholderia anthina]
MCACALAGTIQTQSSTALAGRLVMLIDALAIALIESSFEYSSREEMLASATCFTLDLILFNEHVTTLERSHSINDVWGQRRQLASSTQPRPIPGAYFTGISASAACGC